MKCQVCNVDAPAGASFCQHCGAKLATIDESHFAANLGESPPGGEPPSPPAEAAEDLRSASSGGVRRRGSRDIPEETLWEGTFSPKAMFGMAIGCGVLSLALFVVAMAYASGVWRGLLLLLIVVAWLALALRLAQKRLGISYKLTTHMFYHQRGVLTRVTDRIELIEIHDVTYEQGLFERFVNVGKIKIASGDRTDPILLVSGVEEVESIAQRIDKARRSEQVRRGRRIDFSHIDGET